MTLVLGDFDSLCAPKTEKLGRQQRLQMVGAFMEPLDSKAVDARFEAAFRHYAKQLSDPPAGEEVAQDALVAATQSEIVVLDGAKPGASSELPKDGSFAKIRLPGGFAIDSERPLDFPVPHSYRFDAEKRFFDANPLLAAIPVVARVEQRKSSGDDWEAAPAELQVHFQLVPPDPLPAGSAVAAAPARSETIVKAGKGPKDYIDKQLAANPEQAGDPQADNCVVDRGGKRNPGAGKVEDYFETSARKGFASDRPDPFPVAARSSHPLAVVAATNAKGEAGVIFRPSRQGGDRFKLRAFLDPVGPGGASSDGTEEKAIRIDSGTLVVWRTLRVSGYHQFDYPTGISAADKKDAGGALDDIQFDELAKAYSRAYLELVVERTGAKEHHRIGDAFWVKAINYARNHAPAQPHGVSKRYDVRAMFPNVNATASLIRMRMPGDYDANKGVGFDVAPTTKSIRNRDWQGLLDGLLTVLMRYFTDNAVPGLVILQAPSGDSITQAFPKAELTTSGVAVVTRGCYLFYGSQSYKKDMPYNLNSNALHEMGHCLFLPHQWTEKDAKGAVSEGVPSEHDYKDYCIMSYQKNTQNFTDYCGRCNLKLRGWDTSKIPKNNK
jgi:hypothetical protein